MCYCTSTGHNNPRERRPQNLFLPLFGTSEACPKLGYFNMLLFLSKMKFVVSQLTLCPFMLCSLMIQNALTETQNKNNAASSLRLIDSAGNPMKKQQCLRECGLNALFPDYFPFLIIDFK